MALARAGFMKEMRPIPLAGLPPLPSRGFLIHPGCVCLVGPLASSPSLSSSLAHLVWPHLVRAAAAHL